MTTSQNPVVTVVIPTYGKWEYTQRCLTSIEAELPTTPFEVIVVDDASPDSSADRVALCGGVRLVRSEQNIGFVRACNLGASHARGRYLLFLNNDTEVLPCWMDALAGVLDRDPDVGLVGSRLIYPDHSLQESGGIVWRDGTASNYGRGDDPDRSIYEAVRDVDYCSGASIMVRRELFDQIGGFDVEFAPAYYEDTDLAFSVRAAGYRVVVQPSSAVIHHEGISNGTDTSSGVKRYQEINRAKFVQKWSSILADQLEPNPNNVWLARQRTRNSGHAGGIVVVVEDAIPSPDRDSGSVRFMAILLGLAKLDQRVVLLVNVVPTDQRHLDFLHEHGITVLWGREREEFLFSAGRHITLSIVSRPDVAAQWLSRVRASAPNSLVVYDTVDLHFLRHDRAAQVAEECGDSVTAEWCARESKRYRELELTLAQDADVTLVVSKVEQEILGELVPTSAVEILSNIHVTDSTRQSPDGRSGLLFVGNFNHSPNIDAVRWLCDAIFPLVRERHPETVLHIVGNNPPDEIAEMDLPGVVVHGWVSDLVPFYRASRVAVAPLRYGAGVKGKVGEALSLGLPLVGTSVACEAMHLKHGRDVLIGDSAETFAEHICTLLDDDDVWQTLSDTGAETIGRELGPDRARALLAQLIDHSSGSSEHISASGISQGSDDDVLPQGSNA